MSGDPDANTLRDGDSASIFDEQWTIYRKIIDHNYMEHDAILAIIRQLLGSGETTGRLLDLGCGDAELPSRYLPGLRLDAYHGVDRARRPLDFAREKLAMLPLDQHFHHADQNAFQRATGGLNFHVVVLGFALHHNRHAEKAALLAAVRESLAPGGEVLVYDIFLPAGCDRATYFECYLEEVRRAWTALTADEYEHIAAHIREYDFPESMETVQEIGREAGFSQAEKVGTVPGDFHRVIRLA